MTVTGNNAITLRKLTSKVTAEKVYPKDSFAKPQGLVNARLSCFFGLFLENKKSMHCKDWSLAVENIFLNI